MGSTKKYVIQLRSQVRADLITWIQSQRWLGPRPINSVRAGIRLDDKGEVVDVQIISSSGNGGLDNVFLQSIHNAGPFKLPDDKRVRRKLKRLSWGIRI